MGDTTLAMTMVGAGKMELREYPLPEVPIDGAILKIEAAGVCGADVNFFSQTTAPRILGHENVGYIDKLGSIAAQRWGLKEGDLVALEEYLPCYYCEWCHIGEYRHCWATDILNNPGAPRYGSTPYSLEPGLWGGYSQYLYMPSNAVWHRVPKGIPADEASLHIALSNGVQWACYEGGAGPGKSILIQGPGQMGAACTVAARHAGADLIIVTGVTTDADRLEICRKLGADYTIDVQNEDVRERVREITEGKGVDIAVDCTARAGTEPTLVGIDALRTRGGTLVVQGNEFKTFPDFPMSKLANKYIDMRQTRGHSYKAVEAGLQIMGTRKFPLHLMHTHNFPLNEADRAVRATGGEFVNNQRALHVAVMPWSK